jgi:hypothetical protein
LSEVILESALVDECLAKADDIADALSGEPAKEIGALVPAGRRAQGLPDRGHGGPSLWYNKNRKLLRYATSTVIVRR